jgi:hypothetical protein
VSIKITIEELYQQYLNGKSIEQLSKETGMSKWALYKAFQRLKISQEEVQAIEEKDNVVSTPQQPNRVKQFLEALAVIGSILTIYFLYMEFKKRKYDKANQDC